MNDYEEFQNQIRNREWCIGWKQEDTQIFVYYQALFQNWHDANVLAVSTCQPGFTPFVDAATETIPCPRCNGTGDADRVRNDHNCAHCHGRGRIRKP